MTDLRTLTRVVVALALSCVMGVARAEMVIDIIGGGANRHAVSVVPFKNENPGTANNLTPVIRNDLALSGEFRVVDGADVANVPFEPGEVKYPLWQAKGVQSVAIGKVEPAAGGQMTISFRLMDVAQHTQLTSGQFTVPPDRVREVAHTIADMIYQAITGQKGIFNTRLAYVLKSGRSYQLQIADVDGARAQTVLRSKEPIMSPTWSPNGRYLAYVSFETQKPVVWVQDLSTGSRRPVANFKGSNSAPAWSPDGSTLAVVLTTTGNSQIYLVPMEGGRPRRVSYSDGIDTEPAFSSDGSRLLFVSDRAGGPQIYSMPVTGGQAQRQSWNGAYNVSPRVAPDGKSFAYVRREAGKFRVVIQDSSGDRYLSDGPDNQRPSYAPNGRMVLYASEAGGKSVLYAATVDGSSKIKLAVINGDVQDPAWGPFNTP